MSVVGETTNGFYFSEDIVNFSEENNNIFDNEEMEIYGTDVTPEDLARKCCVKFLEEAYNCGSIDTHHSALFLFLMAISTNQAVSKLKLGRISEYTKSLLRTIYKLFGVKFKITEVEADDYDEEIPEEFNEEQEDDLDDENDNFEEYKEKKDKVDAPKKFIFSCIGIGLKNVARIEE